MAQPDIHPFPAFFVKGEGTRAFARFVFAARQRAAFTPAGVCAKMMSFTLSIRTIA